MLVSVVIRVRNAAKDLQLCIESLSKQELPEATALEFIVVDNESSDESARVAEDLSAKVVSISKSEFTWGRALNLGIGQSCGAFVVLISADVEPIGRYWLTRMLEAAEGENVAAVYGRQVPRPNAPIDEVARLEENFPLFDSQREIPIPSPFGNLRYLSNACALIRRCAWEQVIFDELCDGAEEQIWMKQLFQFGYKYIYEPQAEAYHSHRDPIARGAYRLWELNREGLARKGRQPSVGSTVYAVAAICKRRLRNVIFTEAPARSRVEGLFCLPIEVLGFLICGLLEAIGLDRRRVRNLMWH
jgi:rhamnosyltransferase